MREAVGRGEGTAQPVHVWVPSIGISGMLFYTGDRFPEWQGDMLVAGLGGQRLIRGITNPWLSGGRLC